MNAVFKSNPRRLILFTSIILLSNLLFNLSFSQASISQVKEIETLRTENSKTFFNSDNSLTVYSYSGPIHFKDASLKWQEIDNGLISLNSSYQNKANNFKVSFDNHSLSSNLVNFKFKNKEIKFGLINLNQNLNNVFENPSDVASSLNLNSINYSGIFPNIDLKYIVLAKGIKEEIILKSPPATNKTPSCFYSINQQALLTKKKQMEPSVLLRIKQKKNFSISKDLL